MPSGRQARAEAAAIVRTEGPSEPQATPAERLLALFDGRRLSPGQRRIAQYLVDHLTEAAFLSITELADRVGVSRPSVTRFSVSLGFTGYPALREALQPIALSAVAGAGAPEIRTQKRHNELQGAVDAEIANLQSVRRLLADTDLISGIGHDLAHSVPLTVLGLRISGSLAEYFAYAARRIHPDVRVVSHGGSVAYDALLQARAAGGTWVLAFAMPRHAHETLGALRAARSAGLRVLLITDPSVGPVTEDADVVLTAGTGARLVFDSYTAPGMLSAALIQAMADADPERTQARLEQYEQAADQHGFFF
ncbi:MurR/RpiR family transcriptional regulator [Streptomyces sp. NPDC056632]|uniref:MurR/RpiR family transcriptional regulator n=1 Tax=Streptomyces sp. NPDC056632 TaxID=3345884 RepID=UPI00367B12EC